MSALLGRIKRLEDSRPGLPPPEKCPQPIVGAEIEPGAPLPDEADVLPCKNCSGRHVQVVVEEVMGP